MMSVLKHSRALALMLALLLSGCAGGEGPSSAELPGTSSETATTSSDIASPSQATEPPTTEPTPSFIGPMENCWIPPYVELYERVTWKEEELGYQFDLPRFIAENECFLASEQVAPERRMRPGSPYPDAVFRSYCYETRPEKAPYYGTILFDIVISRLDIAEYGHKIACKDGLNYYMNIGTEPGREWMVDYLVTSILRCYLEDTLRSFRLLDENGQPIVVYPSPDRYIPPHGERTESDNELIPVRSEDYGYELMVPRIIYENKGFRNPEIYFPDYVPPKREGAISVPYFYYDEFAPPYVPYGFGGVIFEVIISDRPVGIYSDELEGMARDGKYYYLHFTKFSPPNPDVMLGRLCEQLSFYYDEIMYSFRLIGP